MPYLIYTDVESAIDFCKRIDKSMKYPEQDFCIYDTPRMHPKEEKWEVFIEDYALEFMTNEEKENVVGYLTQDWNQA